MKILALAALAASLCAAPDPVAPFEAPAEATLVAPGVVSTTQGEYSPWYDAVHRELYFMRRTPGVFDYTIYVSSWTEQGWSEPRVAPFSGTHRDAAPSLSPDGERLYFDSRRPDPALDDDSIAVFTAERTDDGWSDARLVASPSIQPTAPERAGNAEFGPVVDAAGNLYVYSFRPPFRGGARYVSPDDGAGPTTLTTATPDTSASTFVSYLYVSPDGRFALTDGASDGRRDSDIFATWRRDDGTWTAPQRVDLPGVNTRYGETNPSMSADGALLFFTSGRPTGDDAASSANLYVVDARGLRDRRPGD